MPLSVTQIEDSADKLGAMANGQRLAILALLTSGEMSVGEINQKIDLSQSSLSQHLAVLRKSNLVMTRRDAQVIYYSVTSIFALRVLDVLEAVLPM